MDIIEKTEKASYKSTILILEDKVKRQYQINNLEEQSEIGENYIFTNGVIEPKIEVSGELPKNGFIEINNNNKTQLRLLNDKYCALKRFDESDVTVFDVDDRLCNIVVDVALNVNLDGGSTTQVFNSRYNSNTTVDLTNPTKLGYIFDGWNVTGATINDDTLNIGNEDIDLLAEWDIEEYDITYTLNDGTIEGKNPISYTIGDDDITLINPSKYGYAFDGWTGSNGDIPQKTIILPTGSIGEKNYIANWTLITYTIKYNCDENSGSIPDSIHTYGETKALSTSQCYKVIEGSNGIGMVYYVSQWKTSLLPDAITYDAEEEVLNLTEIPNSIVDLYPEWTNAFSYNGSYYVEDDLNGKWRIKLKGSGIIIPSYNMNVDIFLVGGGGGGGKSSFTSGDQAGGGGGYAVTKTNIPLIRGKNCSATIGAGGAVNQGGKTTSIVVDGTAYSAPGGQTGAQSSSSNGGTYGFKVYGGAGGSGGGGCGGMTSYKGGSDGADGISYGGKGQDNTAGYAKTTREFGEANGDLYSGGGSGQSGYSCNGGTGANGGGGKACSNGVANTGGGGGGRASGGSGIIVIRPH